MKNDHQQTLPFSAGRGDALIDVLEPQMLTNLGPLPENHFLDIEDLIVEADRARCERLRAQAEKDAKFRKRMRAMNTRVSAIQDLAQILIDRLQDEQLRKAAVLILDSATITQGLLYRMVLEDPEG